MAAIENEGEGALRERGGTELMKGRVLEICRIGEK